MSQPVPNIWLAVALAAALLSVAEASRAARADMLEIDDKDRAVLSKETLKQKRQTAANAASGRPGRGDASQCGKVDIGNSDSDKKGSSRIAEREKTVIVAGNVFNTANCR